MYQAESRQASTPPHSHPTAPAPATLTFHQTTTASHLGPAKRSPCSPRPVKPPPKHDCALMVTHRPVWQQRCCPRGTAGKCSIRTMVRNATPRYCTGNHHLAQTAIDETRV
ncbi:hypothetical protein THER5_1922 [Bifidobacterium thermacidophilum subsp. thermacidophilum]|uniref:Uncharacterized protein n=1 Tax=Bifidobacterium thermacidophilum subsp. thermacidophilum TaxID=79262 RepID=A0A087E385_9BIFI|nr:hypothetical protein THER5_1922 [Bifidobacterium thermacidophilum subsp. thermacidophilum]